VRSLAGVVIFAACGPGLAEVDTRDLGRETLTTSSSDADDLETLFRGRVTNGGLWFADAACASQFGEPGDVAPAQQKAFAHCLAGLHMQPSKRDDALADVVVMEYAPGIEIEVRVARELGGPHLSWIGFEARRADDPMAPTLTAAAFEALRTSGDRNGPIDPAAAATLKLDPTPTSHAQFTWFRLCLDDDGNLASLRHTETTSPEAAEAFHAAAQTWTFKPPTIAGKAMPACAMVRMTYPPDQGPATETIPMPSPQKRDNVEPIVFAPGVKSVEAKRISGEKLIVPDQDTRAAIAHSKIQRARGTFRLCLDAHGDVIEVLPVRSTGYATYDREIIERMMLWEYSPFVVDGKSSPVCTHITFVYSQR
jgi:hypothetical protein